MKTQPKISNECGFIPYIAGLMINRARFVRLNARFTGVREMDKLRNQCIMESSHGITGACLLVIMRIAGKRSGQKMDFFLSNQVLFSVFVGRLKST